MRYYTTLAQRVSLALPPRGSAPKPRPQREAHETLTLARNALLEGIHYYVVQPLGLPDDPVTVATLKALMPGSELVLSLNGHYDLVFTIREG